MTDAIPLSWRADADELARVASGDAGAFRRLYDAHHGRIVRLAYGILQDREQARDVAHEVLVKLFRHAHRWVPRATLATWLRHVAVNECLSWRRRLRRARIDHSDDAAASIDAAVDDNAVAADALAQVKQRKRSLRAALAGLSPRDRAIVVLHVDEDLAPHEIAEALGLSDNAARVALHRATSRLHDAMLTAGGAR